MNRPNITDPYVSTAQVSQALGVSVTTVKRWVDDAILPAHRTAGGHRKLMMADVLRAVRLGNLPQADLSAIAPGADDAAGLLRRFIAAANSIDADAIRGVIHGAYRAGLAIEVIADEIIAPGMAHLGHRWVAGKVNVMHEHCVSQACLAALFELRAMLRGHSGSRRPVAVGGAPEHDYYQLPSMLAKLTLLDCGWDAIDIGPHTPFNAFHAAFDELSPRLVWISITTLRDAAVFRREYSAFYAEASARGVAVALGGQGFTPSLRAQLPCTTTGSGLAQLAAFARILHRPPQRPKRGRPKLMANSLD